MDSVAGEGREIRDYVLLLAKVSNGQGRFRTHVGGLVGDEKEGCADGGLIVVSQ